MKLDKKKKCKAINGRLSHKQMLEHPQQNILCSSIIVGMMVFHLQLKFICAMDAFLRVFFQNSLLRENV